VGDEKECHQLHDSREIGSVLCGEEKQLTGRLDGEADVCVMPEPVIPEHAQCKACGYFLRGLSEHRCPECGRAFDPTDEKTMHLGRRAGVIGTWLLGPTGWRPVIAMLIAAALMAVATRWPRGNPGYLLVDVLYYFRDLHIEPRLLSYTDWAYVGGLLLIFVTIIYYIARAIARLIAKRTFQHLPERPTDARRRAALVVIAGVVAGGAVMLGWPYRLARLWVRQILTGSGPFWSFAQPPMLLDKSQQLLVLRTGLLELPTPRERLGAMKLLIEGHPQDALPMLERAALLENDGSLCAAQLRMIGLFQDVSSVDTVLALRNSFDPRVRAAAIDAIGLIHSPAFSFEGISGTDTDPTVAIDRFFFRLGNSADEPRNRAIPQQLPARVRSLVEQTLLHGATSEEREAAARALLRWQSGYKLRCAEWGVFVDDGTGQLTLLQSVIDEIPPFVHRTGDTLAELAQRVDQPNPIMWTTKPILHFTVDRPMVVDVRVLITDGRPLFAFPKPDDFAISALKFDYGNPFASQRQRQAIGRAPLKPFDQPEMPKLTDAREGYPWLLPHHLRCGSAFSSSHAQDAVLSVGLHWQSLIVSPTRLEWMDLPPVPADPKYQWWDRLRQVPCAYVSSRGESDRFLYYDGPTRAKPPVVVQSNGTSLRFSYNDNSASDPGLDRPFEQNRTTIGLGPRHGMFIRVSAGGAAAGSVIELPDRMPAGEPFSRVADSSAMAGESLAAALLKLLTDAGLSDAEASGLIDCWRPQFFHTPGERFLLVMTPADYDYLCPIRIDPPPTELVRVGLVLTEFGSAPK
jgi:hypothetical protein